MNLIEKTVIRTILIGIACMFMLAACCNKVKHLGTKKEYIFNIQIDSLELDASFTSGQGNFFLQDSCLVFADSYFACFYRYELNSMKYIDKYFGLGNDSINIGQFLYAYPVNHEEARVFAINNIMELRVINVKDWIFDSHKQMIFNWTGKPDLNYENTSNYTPSTNEFGCSFTKIDDSLYYFPLRTILNLTSPHQVLEKEYYRKNHIFGVLNIKNMKVTHLFGHMPEIYSKKSVPHIQLFDYSVCNDTIYVSHAVDSLIYVYKFPDQLLYVMGYENKGINRNYSETRDLTKLKMCFEKDKSIVGLNIALKFIPENKILLRNYVETMKNWKCGLQIYYNCNLIGDLKMPSYFQILGYKYPYYYGIRMKPYETDEYCHFMVYRFRIPIKEKKTIN